MRGSAWGAPERRGATPRGRWRPTRGSPPIPTRSGRARLLRQNIEAAAALLFQRLARLEPGATRPWLDLADCLTAAGDLDGALEALAHWRGLVESPAEDRVVLGLAAALVDAGRTDDAATVLDPLVGARPRRPRVGE